VHFVILSPAAGHVPGFYKADEFFEQSVKASRKLRWQLRRYAV
jgi:hypothetical protein